MAKAKITHPRLRAILGIVAIILIVIFANWLVGSTSLGNKTVDLTEDKRHTLTDGTKAILGELETPVIIRYYVTRKSEAMPRQIKNYVRKVDDLLKRYVNLSDGKIRIEYLDPQPDTDAEDSANLDGISGQNVNDENLYFGLSVSCLDQQTAIPFLNPSAETMLEYHLSSAIANVSTFKKPTVGLMTTLPILGSPARSPGQQPRQPWIIYQRMRQLYDVQYIGMAPEELDPEKMPVLLLVHPAGLNTQTEFLIDQYVLKGGIVVACLDPFALTAPEGNPMMRGMGGVPKFSTLPSLLPSWGIGFDATSVVADGKYATDFGNGQRMHSQLSLSRDAITSDDEILTKGFENLYFLLPGGFTIKGGGGVAIETLVKTSNEVVFVAGMAATRADPGLFARMAPSGKNYGLVMRLKGKFKTAFPEGNPADAQKKNQKPNEENASKEKEDPNSESLKEAVKEGVVYLIADADFLYDTVCYRGFEPANNNVALLENILDQSLGSRHLIGSRSRAATIRPFTVIKEMETDFEQEERQDLEKIKKADRDLVAEIEALRKKVQSGTTLALNDSDQRRLVDLQAKRISLRRELRDKQKGLKTRKDQLYSKLRWMTVGITPTLMALVGLGVWLYRRRVTRAV